MFLLLIILSSVCFLTDQMFYIKIYLGLILVYVLFYAWDFGKYQRMVIAQRNNRNHPTKGIDKIL